MDFALTEEQQLIKAMAGEFARTKVAPIAAEIDQNRRFPNELIPELRELNLLGVPFPEEYGGAGADFLSYVIVIEELAKVCASTAIIVANHTCLCVWPIYKFGNESQKKEYLPKLASGEWLGAFGLTEPSAGTDAASMKTTAVAEGDQWVLNGSKIFITNGGQADVFVIFAHRPCSGNAGHLRLYRRKRRTRLLDWSAREDDGDQGVKHDAPLFLQLPDSPRSSSGPGEQRLQDRDGDAGRWPDRRGGSGLGHSTGGARRRSRLREGTSPVRKANR